MTTVTTESEKSIRTLEISKQEMISAPVDIVFETVLEQLGPLNETMPGKPLPMKLEAWPGGRWYRDLGEGAGHFWGHVQVIKPPALLEICGPLFMSYPAVSHIQYRLTADGNKTQLDFLHRAIGLIQSDHSEGVNKGWGMILGRIREAAERRPESRGVKR